MSGLLKMAENSKRGASLLCDVAKIPEQRREGFLIEAKHLIYETWRNSQARDLKKWISQEEMRAIKDIEAGVRIAYGAIQSLPKERLEYLQHLLRDATPYWPSDNSIVWKDALLAMVAACARISGKSPRVSPRSGPRPGRPPKSSTKETYPLQTFIKRLARIVKANGGHLTLYRQERRGTWIDALVQLAPLLPAGLVPNRPSLSLIETTQAQVNSEKELPF
jgi:hypothetical protein